MPTKIYRIKMNDFWINVSYNPPHYARQKTKKSNVPKWDKCLQITTSPISKSQKLLPFARHRLSDISIAIHSNSIAGSVHNRFAVKQTYCEHDYVPRYWIWMNSYWSVQSLHGGKGAGSVIWNWTCLWFEGIYLIFGTFDFFVFWRG